MCTGRNGTQTCHSRSRRCWRNGGKRCPPPPTNCWATRGKTSTCATSSHKKRTPSTKRAGTGPRSRATSFSCASFPSTTAWSLAPAPPTSPRTKSPTCRKSWRTVSPPTSRNIRKPPPPISCAAMGICLSITPWSRLSRKDGPPWTASTRKRKRRWHKRRRGGCVVCSASECDMRYEVSGVRGRLRVFGRGGALRGEVVVPGDKSISHRAVMLAA
ncbi:MAG: hypothetical protein KC418_21860, partial [Anaerolineales bacterium]|nr:hypothetical protein [Anaerolineales bacterium]